MYINFPKHFLHVHLFFLHKPTFKLDKTQLAFTLSLSLFRNDNNLHWLSSAIFVMDWFSEQITFTRHFEQHLFYKNAFKILKKKRIPGFLHLSLSLWLAPLSPAIQLLLVHHHQHPSCLCFWLFSSLSLLLQNHYHHTTMYKYVCFYTRYIPYVSVSLHSF